jgi:hypothetical protein
MSSEKQLFHEIENERKAILANGGTIPEGYVYQATIDLVQQYGKQLYDQSNTTKRQPFLTRNNRLPTGIMRTGDLMMKNPRGVTPLNALWLSEAFFKPYPREVEMAKDESPTEELPKDLYDLEFDFDEDDAIMQPELSEEQENILFQQVRLLVIVRF